MPGLDERAAILETKQQHYEEKIDKMSAQLDEVHEVLLRAKGIRWIIVTVSSVVGFVLGVAGSVYAFIKH